MALVTVNDDETGDGGPHHGGAGKKLDVALGPGKKLDVVAMTTVERSGRSTNLDGALPESPTPESNRRG